MFDSAERKHPASAQKRRRVREEGGVARSLDLSSHCVLVVALAVLWWSGPRLVADLTLIFDLCLRSPESWAVDSQTIADLLTPITVTCLRALLPLLAVVCIASCLSNALQHGFLFSPKPWIDWNRVDPMQRLAQMTSARVVDQSLLSILRVLAACVTAVVCIRTQWTSIQVLPALDLQASAASIWTLAMQVSFSVATVLLLISFVDYALQWWRFEQSLRMTDEEVREENRNSTQQPRTRQSQRPAQKV